MPADDFLLNSNSNNSFYHAQGLPVHNEYRNYIGRWQYLMRSYLGGAQFKLGRYLTRYVYENEGEFANRLARTPLDNHCKSIVHIYNSFLYRNEPKRDLGSLENKQEMEQFFQDCDMEGRTFKSFMRDVNIMSSVYGHCVVLVDRPETQVGTKAEELDLQIRPYLTLYTAENVLDWRWTRLPSGHYELEYVKFLEQDQKTFETASTYHVRTWTKDQIILESYSPDNKDPIQFIESKPNPIGKIPAVWVYANRSPIRGIGVSDINDVADQQQAIFNELSEIEQLIRISNAPSLVKTPETDAQAGAGAIITMPNETDPGLKPYILQPNGQNLESILKSIESKIKSIDKMAHLGAIRSFESRPMSAASLQAEFLLMDSKLNEKGQHLELAEEQIFRMFAIWQGQAFDGEIKYPTSFHIRDRSLDMQILTQAAAVQRDSANASPEIKRIFDQKIKEILATDEEDLEKMSEMQHPTTTPATRSAHIQEMIMQGFTDQRMLNLHPEMTQVDIDNAKQELLNANNKPPQEI